MAFAGSSGRAQDAQADVQDARQDEPRARAARATRDDPARAHGDGARDVQARDARPREGGSRDAGSRDAGSRPAARPHDDAPRSRPRGRPFVRSVEVNWPRAGTFGAGLAVGVLLGAGLALVLAPTSGPATRRRLGRAGRRATLRAADAWADLGEELRHATFRTRRKLRRRVDERLGRDDSLLGSLRRRRERHGEDDASGRERRRVPWARGERDTIAVEL